MFGGFPNGGGDGTFEAPDWLAQYTILSVDVGDHVEMSDNSYHVIRGDGVTRRTVMDGFYVAYGNANGRPT